MPAAFANAFAKIYKQIAMTIGADRKGTLAVASNQTCLDGFPSEVFRAIRNLAQY